MDVKKTTIMKHVIKCLFLALCLNGLLSCDSNDDNGLLSENTRLVKFGEDTYSYDDYGRIKKIDTGIGDWDFSYENSLLTKVTHHITHPDLMDGGVWFDFSYEDNKVIVEKSYEPDFRIIREEIELNEDGYAIRISDAGVYDRNEDGWYKDEEGYSYTELNYERPAMRLTSMETFSLDDSSLLETTVFEYDQSFGIMLGLHAPAPWFFTYFGLTLYRDVPFLSFFGTNLVKKTVTNQQENTTEHTEYTYTFKNELPITVRKTNSEETVKIGYEILP